MDPIDFKETLRNLVWGSEMQHGSRSAAAITIPALAKEPSVRRRSSFTSAVGVAGYVHSAIHKLRTDFFFKYQN